MAKALNGNERSMFQQRNTFRQDAENSVVVKNLLPTTTQEAIIIHFQKRRNGGGEVESVRLLGEGVAVVTFETSQVAESVLARGHVIDGVQVTVERNPPSCPDQIFGKVSARIDPDTLGISFSSMEAILQKIRDETNVQCKRIFDGFVVSGTFEQIKRVHELLDNHLQQKKQNREETSLKYSSRSMFKDSSSIRKSTAGSKPFEVPWRLSPGTDSRETIDDTSVRKYNKPLESAKIPVKEYTSHGNRSLPERYIQGKFTISEAEAATNRGQRDLTRALPRTQRDESPPSSTRNGYAKPTVSELKSKGRPGAAAVTAPSVVLYEKNKEEASEVRSMKTGTTVHINALPLSGASEDTNTSNADGERDREESKENRDVESRQMPLGQSKGKTEPTDEKSSSISPAISEASVQAHISSATANNGTPREEETNSTNTEGEKQEREESKENGVVDLQMALDQSMREAEPPLQWLVAGILKQNESCKDVQSESTLTNEHCTEEDKTSSTLPQAISKACVQSDISTSTTANNGKQREKEMAEEKTGDKNRPTASSQSEENLIDFSENSKDRRSKAVKQKTVNGVHDDALPLLQVPSGTDGNGQDRKESTGNGDVKEPQMVRDKSREKTEPLSQCLAKGTLKQDETLKSVKSESTFTNGKYSAEKSSSIIPAIGKACETSFGSQNTTPKSAEVIKQAEPVPNENEKYNLKGNSLKYKTPTGVKVTLVKGDITDHDVNVLVCPANPTLTYKDGLSRLILEQGGQGVIDECLSIAQSKGPLEYGTTCFTSSGELPCRVVLHPVLPRWVSEKENEKNVTECKRQIHRCLKDGVILASGRRYRSMAFPSLGQDWNCIPMKVSAEIITRVIAVFSKNIGPMHSGVNDFRIVCEDDATFETFAKELTSFSFSGEKPFFLSATTKIKLEDVDQFLKPQNAERHNDSCDQDADSSNTKERPVEQMQKAPSLTKTDSHLDEESGKTHAVSCSAKVETDTSSQTKLNSPESPAILPSGSGLDNGFSSNITNESAATFVSCGYIKGEVVLEVTEATAVGLKEGTTKHVAVRDNTKEGLVTKLNLNMCKTDFKAFVMETGELSEESSTPNISKPMTPEIRQPKPSHFSDHNKRTEGIPVCEAHSNKGSAKETTSVQPSLIGQETSAVSSSNSSLPKMNVGAFITSPTVEALLNADLQLGVQGLQIEHGMSRNINKKQDHDKRSGNALPFKQKQVITDETSFTPSCNSKSTENQSNQLVTETHSEKDINDNRELKVSPAPAKTNTIKEPAKKCEYEEGQETKDDLQSATLVENNHYGFNWKVSSAPETAFLCALCEDAVDHPDLIHPNVCAEHKFCDDCIVKAFTFSNNCPACVDTYGLLRESNVEHNGIPATKGLHDHPGREGNHNDLPLTLARPVFLQANQPPGQMMWKRYEDNLPGFEDYGTIVVCYIFYDGIQSSEHPNPGKTYTGMSCKAYLPDTQEGRIVLKLLGKAFDARLVFTVAKSASDGTGHVALNGVELKTTAKSGARSSYPDSGYLSRVRKQLAAKGIQ